MHVGSYAERDAEITFGLWQEMKKEIIHQDLEDVFDLETELFPCLVDMKFKGVRVDIDKAHLHEKTISARRKRFVNCNRKRNKC